MALRSGRPARARAGRGRTVSKLLLSIERQTVSISGASRRAADQAAPVERLDGAARSGLAASDRLDGELRERSGSRVRSGLVGSVLVSMLKRTSGPAKREELFEGRKAFAVGRLLLGNCWPYLLPD